MVATYTSIFILVIRGCLRFVGSCGNYRRVRRKSMVYARYTKMTRTQGLPPTAAGIWPLPHGSPALVHTQSMQARLYKHFILKQGVAYSWAKQKVSLTLFLAVAQLGGGGMTYICVFKYIWCSAFSPCPRRSEGTRYMHELTRE